jgi:hypothetical protein
MVFQEDRMSVMKRIAALSDEVKVASVSAICIMALVVVLKNVLHVPTDQLTRDMVLFSFFYAVFWMIPWLGAWREKKSRFGGALLWSLLIVAITAAIITLYAV